MGKFKGIAVGAMRVARENGFLTVKVQLSNITSSNQTMYYRFAWLGADGFPVGDEEAWKALTLYAQPGDHPAGHCQPAAGGGLPS